MRKNEEDRGTQGQRAVKRKAYLTSIQFELIDKNRIVGNLGRGGDKDNFLSLSPESLLEQGSVFSALFHNDSSQLEAVLSP